MTTAFLIPVVLSLISTGLSQGAALPTQTQSTIPRTDMPPTGSSDIITPPLTNISLTHPAISADGSTSPSSSSSSSSSSTTLSAKATPNTTSQYVMVLCRPTTSSRTNKGKPLSRNLWLIAFLCIAICIVVGPLVMLIAKCLPPADETQISEGADD
ncbi:integrator complex subunit 6 homolog [Sardina pilchardus]|uniref:integrator complex subunit 6 homolog n=1 Tax=Sardina pilchardus TaxID=27697 RepID=UPI002E127629